MEALLTRIIVIVLISAIPFSEIVRGLRTFVRSISGQLSTPKPVLRMSREAFFRLLLTLIKIGQGFIVFRLIDVFTFTFTEQLLLTLLALVAHSWSPFLAFRPAVTIGYFIVGLFAASNILLAGIYCLGFFILALLFNSVTIGSLLNIINLFVWIYILELPELLILTTFILFIVIAARQVSDIIRIFENNPKRLSDTLLMRWSKDWAKSS